MRDVVQRSWQAKGGEVFCRELRFPIQVFSQLSHRLPQFISLLPRCTSPKLYHTYTLCSKRNGSPVLLPLSFLHDAAFETEISEIGKSKLIFSFQNASPAICHLNVAILTWSIHRVLGKHYSTCDARTDCLLPYQVCESQPPLKQRGDHFLSPLHFIIELLVWMCGICTHRNFHPMSLPSQLESHPKSPQNYHGQQVDKDGTRSWGCSNHNYFLASWCPFSEVSAFPP
jgi:hypothetical protein